MSNKTFFTSDTHYDHLNIIRGTSQWKSFEPGSSHQAVRDFDTQEEHNQQLVNNINETVDENDTLYHLGDWSFNGIENIWKFRKQIKCKNIHLILGNHDHHLEKPKLMKPEFQQEAVKLGYYNPFNYLDLFKSVSYYKEITIEKQRIIMSHYSMRVWNKSHHGSWMLYGHSHGSLPEYGKITIINTSYIESYETFHRYKTMDVGVDANPDFKPYSFEEIKEIMKSRVSLQVDHHGPDTN